MSNKKRFIGKAISRTVAINKIVSVNAQEAAKRRHKTITRLNKIIDNPVITNADGKKVKKYSPSKVLQAKNHLNRIHAKSFATTDSIALTSNTNDWRPTDVNPAR